MDLSTILSSTIIATLCSGIISYVISRKKDHLQYITGERKEWREQIREIAHKLCNASYEETIIILTDLKVRINAFGGNDVLNSYNSDVHIWKVIHEIETEKMSIKRLRMKQKQLIQYLSYLLKVDWERSKNEVKGNIFDTISWMILIVDGIYFMVSAFLCNENGQIDAFTLFSLAAINVVGIVALNVVLNFEIALSCKEMLKGGFSSKRQPIYRRKFIVCCGICGLGFLINLGAYVYCVVEAFTLFGNGHANYFCIILLAFLYALGLGFHLASQYGKIEQSFFYAIAIDNIRTEYEKGELDEGVEFFGTNSVLWSEHNIVKGATIDGHSGIISFLKCIVFFVKTKVLKK